MKTKLASSLAFVVKSIRCHFMLLTARAQIYCISRKERKKERKKDFLREMCRTAVDAKALWKRRLTKPMSGKFPYYFLQDFFFFPTSRYEYCGVSQKQMDYYSRHEMIWSYE
jgi:hypothetical protein